MPENVEPRVEESSSPYHIDLLRQTLSHRKNRNSRYSLRAFAYHLRLDPAALSRILAGKQDISLRSAQKVGLALGLSEADGERFRNSVTSSMKEKADRFFESPDGAAPGTRMVASQAESTPSARPLARYSLRIGPDRLSEACSLLQTFSQALEKMFGDHPSPCTIEVQLVQPPESGKGAP